MENDTRSTKTTTTSKTSIEYCRYCQFEIKPGHEKEKALDRDNIDIGTVHSGHCAHQWRLKIIGAEGFRGRG